MEIPFLVKMVTQSHLFTAPIGIAYANISTMTRSTIVQMVSSGAYCSKADQELYNQKKLLYMSN